MSRWVRRLGIVCLCVAIANGASLAEPRHGISEELRQAAERGDKIAIDGAARDAMRRKEFTEAAYWYRRGAELGDDDSQLSYAWMLLKGMGVARDEAEAFRWFLAAANNVNSYAPLATAEMYAAGQGTARDPIEAFAYALTALEALQSSETDARNRAAALRTRLEGEL